MTPTELTEDFPATKVLTTPKGSDGVSILVKADVDLGGGTLTAYTRPGRSNTDWEAIKNVTTGTNLVAGDQMRYYIGSNAEFGLGLAGSTSPSGFVYSSTIDR